MDMSVRRLVEAISSKSGGGHAPSAAFGLNGSYRKEWPLAVSDHSSDLKKHLLGSWLFAYTGWSIALQAGYAALSFLVAVLLAGELGAEDYGMDAYTVAVVNALVLLAHPGLPALVTREDGAGHGPPPSGTRR